MARVIIMVKNIQVCSKKLYLIGVEPYSIWKFLANSTPDASGVQLHSTTLPSIAHH
jgi:hypothetical protein